MHDTAFLGKFAKFEKPTTSFVMYVCLSFCLSVCPSTWNDSAPSGRSSGILIFESFSEIPQQYSSSIKFVTRLMNIFIYDTISLDCLRKEIFHRNLEKSKKYILCSNVFCENLAV